MVIMEASAMLVTIAIGNSFAHLFPVTGVDMQRAATHNTSAEEEAKADIEAEMNEARASRVAHVDGDGNAIYM